MNQNETRYGIILTFVAHTLAKKVPVLLKEVSVTKDFKQFLITLVVG